MNNKVSPKKCPACEQQLFVEKLRCTSCKTAIEGEFSLPRLGRLSKEDQNFIELLVLADGSLKSVAQRLKLSYPTVRRLLDNVIQNLVAEIKADETERGENAK